MKPFKSIREGNSVEPGVSEINDVPEDPLSYIEIKPKKTKMVKEASKLGDLAHETTLKHRFLVTYSDPKHTMVSKRKEHQQKHVLVPSTKDGQTVYAGEAEPLVKKYMKKQGYKVHNVEHVGMVSKKVNEGTDQMDKESKQNEPKDKHRALQRAMTATPKKPAGEYERKVTSYLKKKYNEETEQIDELKTSTLLRYHTKAGKSGLQAGIQGSNAMDAGNTADAMTHFKKSDKRMKGQAQAMGKIQKRYATEGVDIHGIWESLKPEPVVEAFDAEAHKKELDRLMTKHMNAHAETTRLIKAKASQEDINKAQERNNAVKAEISSHKDKAPKGPAPKPGSAAHYYASKKPGEYTGD